MWPDDDYPFEDEYDNDLCEICGCVLEVRKDNGECVNCFDEFHYPYEEETDYEDDGHTASA